MTADINWKILTGDSGAEEKLTGELTIHPVISRLLINLGITEPSAAKEYLNPNLTQLHDPQSMEGMEAAVERIILARDTGEQLTVYGDYDVDGVSSTALLIHFFTEINIKARYYIPDRRDEGYGLNRDAMTAIHDDGSTLVITVDTGATAHDSISFAKSIGLDVIVTDHHRMEDEPPEAVSVVNPSSTLCDYPYSDLCGVGTAFKLCMAIRSALHNGGVQKEELPNLRRHLDLVALGTIADVAPLTGENRVLVWHGLHELSNPQKPGIKALCTISGILRRKVISRDVGFELGPRINSAGRLHNALPALKLLLANGRDEAKVLASELTEINERRKNIQRQIVDEVEEMVGCAADSCAVVLAKTGWQAGVLGIVCSKIAETHHKPTILGTVDGDIIKGSARSFGGFDLYSAMSKLSEHFEKFGGHKKAAGFTMLREKFEVFKVEFDKVAKDMIDQLPEEYLHIDHELDPKDLSPKLLKELDALEPFGQGAPPPVFIASSVSIMGPIKYMGADGSHIRASVEGVAYDLIGFGMASKVSGIDFDIERVDIVYTPEKNHWNGTSKTQLRLIDIRPSP